MLEQAADGTPVADVCPKAGISDATFYIWSKKYAGPMPLGDAGAMPTGGREREVEADRRGPVARQSDAAGRAVKKGLRPARKRELVDRLRED